LSFDFLIQPMQIFTFLAIVAAGLIFTRLALTKKSLGSFRFQLSLFILIWVAAELPNVAANLGLITAGNYADLGLGLHMLSMAAFAIFVGARSFTYLRTKPLPALPMPPKTQMGYKGAIDGGSSEQS
jgi:hypothetical protein